MLSFETLMVYFCLDRYFPSACTEDHSGIEAVHFKTSSNLSLHTEKAQLLNT